MSELNREVEQLYRAYEAKPLRPEAALELASDFVLDLINIFGEPLNESTPLKKEWCQFVPFEFLLSLNNVLGRYKESGHNGLSEEERALLADHGVLFGSLLKASLNNHPDTIPGEEHYQIPAGVAEDLSRLCQSS